MWFLTVDYGGLFAPVRAELLGALHQLMGPIGVVFGVLSAVVIGWSLFAKITHRYESAGH
jgi:hypothetical protein